MAFVTQHAAERYVERVNPELTVEQAKAAMMASARAIDTAAAFGASCVRLGNGARLMLQGDVVVTIKTPIGWVPQSRAMLKRFKRNKEK